MYIKSKLVMPVKQLQVSGNIKSMTPLWDGKQLNPSYKDILLVVGLTTTTYIRSYIFNLVETTYTYK